MENVLIIKPSSFGDIIHALPVASRIRQSFPGANISWLVNSQYGRLLEHNPCVDRVIPFHRHLWRKTGTLPKALISFAGLCRELRKARFDTVLDLQGLFRSGFFTALTGAAARAGFATARERAPVFYNRKVAVPPGDLHAVDRYLLVADALGCTEGKVAFPVGIGKSEERWAANLFSGEPHSTVVGLAPSARWETKRWPAEYFSGLGDTLSSKGRTVAVVGGPAGEGANVVELMKGRKIAALGIADPLKLAALLKRLDVLVTNDSGPMHLAAAVGTPVVALFGPTNPRRTGPYGDRHTVICAPVDCRPCYRRVCETGKDCMRRISVETVREAVENILKTATESTEDTEIK